MNLSNEKAPWVVRFRNGDIMALNGMSSPRGDREYGDMGPMRRAVASLREHDASNPLSRRVVFVFRDSTFPPAP